MKGGTILDLLTLIFILSVVTAAILNPAGFASGVSAVGGAVQGESKILTGR
jgi:hypothetical protein